MKRKQAEAVRDGLLRLGLTLMHESAGSRPACQIIDMSIEYLRLLRCIATKGTKECDKQRNPNKEQTT